MAQVTVPHRHTENRTVLIVLAVAALIAAAGFLAYQSIFDSSSGTTPGSVIDSGIVERGPNHDIAPMWGSAGATAPVAGLDRSPGDLTRSGVAELGPNFDIAPMWGVGQAGAARGGVAERGPNSDIAPMWGSGSNS